MMIYICYASHTKAELTPEVLRQASPNHGEIDPKRNNDDLHHYCL